MKLKAREGRKVLDDGHSRIQNCLNFLLYYCCCCFCSPLYRIITAPHTSYGATSTNLIQAEAKHKKQIAKEEAKAAKAAKTEDE